MFVWSVNSEPEDPLENTRLFLSDMVLILVVALLLALIEGLAGLDFPEFCGNADFRLREDKLEAAENETGAWPWTPEAETASFDILGGRPLRFKPWELCKLSLWGV